MSRLLVFCAHDRRPHALVEELDAADELDFTWTSDLGVLDATLAQGSHALCLLLLRGEPSPELAAVLDRAREAGQLRGAVSIHSVPSPSGLRAMLKLGVREAFLEPVTPRRVVQALKLRLRELPGPVVATGAFQERDPIPCELCTYGRVVRLSAARPGSLLVRTNLVLERGAEVVIAGPLMRALGVERARFHAVSPDPAAQGDGYAAAWWLDQPVEAQILAGWEGVLGGLSVVDSDGHAVPAADPRSRCSFVSQARLVAVSTHGFEVATPTRVHADSLVELVGAEVGPRTGLGLYGRYIDGRRLEDPHAGRLRCEVLPISDDPALSLLRAGLAVEEPVVPAGPADPVSRSPSAATVGAAVVLLLLSGLVLAAALTEPPVASGEVASTDAVLAAIRAAFR